MAARNEKTEEIQTNHYSINKNKSSWIVPGLLVVIVVLLVAVLVRGHDRPGRVFTTGGGFGGGIMRSERGISTSGGHFGGSNENHLIGTVTAVNGSTFTIGGHGATNEVTTNSSTKYQNGDSVKVNDTVAVSGTTSNGTFTASEVVINP